MVEHRNGFDLENNRWVDMWYDNGNITIDDICLACKEDIQRWEQQRNADRVLAHQEQIRKDKASRGPCQKEMTAKCG